MALSLENREEANAKVDKKRRYKQILSILDGRQLTAKEIAVAMHDRGYTPSTERNFSAPRLTELCLKGRVCQVGKKICQYTKRAVTVYEVVSEDVEYKSLKEALAKRNISYSDAAALLTERFGRNVNKGEISLALTGKIKEIEKAIRDVSMK